MLRSAALLLCLFGAVPHLAAQTALSGSVRNDEDGAPIAGAEITLLDENAGEVASTLADDDGNFSMQVAQPGAYRLRVRRVGFEELRVDSVAVEEGADTRVEVRMAVNAVPVDPVVVVARSYSVPIWIQRYRERAEANQRAGRGRIITRAQLDETGPIYASQIISQVPWLRRCDPTILINGLPADDTLMSLRGDDLEGVEIYRGVSQIPPEYYTIGMCGLVMFWTRVDGPEMAPLTWKRVGVSAAVILLLGLGTLAF